MSTPAPAAAAGGRPACRRRPRCRGRAQGVRRPRRRLDVDFTVPAGSIVSLIGPNGAGKTTFFNMLTGVYTHTAAASRCSATTSPGKPPHAITQLGVGRTFQNIRLFEHMTAERTCSWACTRACAAGSSARCSDAARTARRAPGPGARWSSCGTRACGAATTTSRATSPYGDQRRLEVARALATDPKLLLLDEPTAGMNPQETAAFTDFVGRVREERGSPCSSSSTT